MIARELYAIMHLERRLHAIFCLFSVAANSQIGCDSVEAPIGAIIAQQLHNSRAIISRACDYCTTVVQLKSMKKSVESPYICLLL